MRKILFVLLFAIVAIVQIIALDMYVETSSIDKTGYLLVLSTADKSTMIGCIFFTRESNEIPRISFYIDNEVKDFGDSFLSFTVSGSDYENMIFKWTGDEKYYYVFNQDTYLAMIESVLSNKTSLMIVSDLYIEGVTKEKGMKEVFHIHLGDDAITALKDIRLFKDNIY